VHVTARDENLTEALVLDEYNGDGSNELATPRT
jgi:hypothetical protein